MKPSRRRDSLAQKKPGRLGDIDKAARKEAFWLLEHFVGPRKELPADEARCLVPRLTRLLQRHGAKVRRETLKEVAPAIASALIGVQFSIPKEGLPFNGSAVGNLKTAERVLTEVLGLCDPRYAKFSPSGETGKRGELKTRSTEGSNPSSDKSLTHRGPEKGRRAQ